MLFLLLNYKKVRVEHENKLSQFSLLLLIEEHFLFIPFVHPVIVNEKDFPTFIDWCCCACAVVVVI